MLFLTLMKAPPSRAMGQLGTLKMISSVASPSAIRIHGVYFTFDRYDGATTQTYKTKRFNAPPVEELSQGKRRLNHIYS